MIDALLSTNSLCYPQQPTGHIHHKAVATCLNRWWQQVRDRDALCHCRPSICNEGAVDLVTVAWSTCQVASEKVVAVGGSRSRGGMSQNCH